MKISHPHIFPFIKWDTLHLHFKRAKFIILLLGIGVFAVKSQSKIYWDAQKPIEFSDFKGEPNIRNVAALSYCGIKFSSCKSGRYPTYEVWAYFEPQYSWVWPNYQYPYVLEHERLHFTIAEIYARKLRKYFSENNVPIREAKGVYEQFYSAFEDYQNKYDDQTRHGTWTKHQQIWEVKITQELEALNDYADYKCY